MGFPENRMEGFSDYSIAVKPMEYYSRLIGDYPYEKLANVQSKTIYGGLENAGTIFYAENSVTGKGRQKDLLLMKLPINGLEIVLLKPIGIIFGSAKVLQPILPQYILNRPREERNLHQICL